MLRRARCWVCGALFEAQRGTLPRGARFACAPCADDGFAAPDVDRGHLSRVLSERHEVAFADVRDVVVEPEVLSLLSEDFCRLHALLPLARRENGAKPLPPALVVALADPANVFALEHVRRETGMRVHA